MAVEVDFAVVVVAVFTAAADFAVAEAVFTVEDSMAAVFVAVDSMVEASGPAAFAAAACISAEHAWAVAARL